MGRLGPAVFLMTLGCLCINEVLNLVLICDYWYPVQICILVFFFFDTFGWR